MEEQRTKGADDDDARLATNLLLSLGQRLLDIGNQLVLIRVRGHAVQRLRGRVGQLPRPVLQSQRSACEASVVSESSNPPPGLRVRQELEIEQGAAAAGEAGEHRVPALLALVAVGELDVDVLQGKVLFTQLLETDDDVVLRRIDPGLLLDNLGAGSLEFGVVEDARGARLLAASLLDMDLVSSVDERLGGGRGQGRAVLEGLGLRAEVKDGGRHGESCSW